MAYNTQIETYLFYRGSYFFLMDDFCSYRIIISLAFWPQIFRRLVFITIIAQSIEPNSSARLCFLQDVDGVK